MSEWLVAHGLPYRDSTEKAYSTDANIWGATHEAKTLEHLDVSLETVQPIMGVRFWDPQVEIAPEVEHARETRTEHEIFEALGRIGELTRDLRLPALEIAQHRSVEIRPVDRCHIGPQSAERRFPADIELAEIEQPGAGRPDPVLEGGGSPQRSIAGDDTVLVIGRTGSDGGADGAMLARRLLDLASHAARSDN